MPATLTLPARTSCCTSSRAPFSIEVAAEKITLQTGDALSFPSDVPHAYGNPTTEPARFTLSVFEPAVGTPARGRTHA